MTNHSPIISSVASPISDKGSTYGKASNTPSPHSFQQQQRGCGSLYPNRTEVLSKEATLFPLYSQSIIRVYEPTRDPTTT
jgi:hypothetical protein